jgi:hypothetical protein
MAHFLLCPKIMFTTMMNCEKCCLVILGIFLVWHTAFAAEPTLESRTVAPQTRVLAGQPCSVEYILEWQGSRDACIVLPLEVSQPEWGHAELAATRTEQDGERWRVTQVVEYRASKAGKFSIAPVEVQVITANQPIVGAFENTPATRVKLPETAITVVNPPNWKFRGGIGAVAALIAATLLALWIYRRRKAVPPGQEEDVVAIARELQHHARRCRLDGDLYACYQSLLKSAEALQSINIEAKGVADAIRPRIPAVGFGGVRPTDDEMDSLFRDVERIIARRNTLPVSEQETQSCR